MCQTQNNKPRKMTSHEIALKFSERYQSEYPKTLIHRLMEDLRKAIDQHVKEQVEKSVRNLNQNPVMITYIDLGPHNEAEELCWFIKMCDRNGWAFRAYAIEANPYSVKLLKTKFKSWPTVEIIHAAITDVDAETVNLYLSPSSGYHGNSIYKSKNNVEKTPVSVPALRLSKFVTGLSPKNGPTVVKCNIEGAEYAMMKDMHRSGTMDSVDIWCGAESDMHKVGDLISFQSEYQGILDHYKIDWMPYAHWPDSHFPGKNEKEQQAMDAKLKELINPKTPQL
jgi:FkbM family methyltransferase